MQSRLPAAGLDWPGRMPFWQTLWREFLRGRPLESWESRPRRGGWKDARHTRITKTRKGKIAKEGGDIDGQKDIAAATRGPFLLLFRDFVLSRFRDNKVIVEH